MTKTTLQLLQLFLAVTGFYAALKYSGDLQKYAPLACLVSIYLLDKIELAVQGEKKDKVEDDNAEQNRKHMEFLLHNKNSSSLTAPLQALLRELQLPVLPTNAPPGIDRLLAIPSSLEQFGIKIIGDSRELVEDWDQWDKLTSFEMGTGQKQRVLLIVNTAKEAGIGPLRFKNFSKKTKKILRARQIIAMSTLTFCKIFRLCWEKKQDPKEIFQLIHQYPGGVFQLEDYSKDKELTSMKK